MDERLCGELRGAAVTLLASTRLQLPGVQPSRTGQVGSVYVHPVQSGGGAVLAANGGHRDYLVNLHRNSGDTTHNENPAWSGDALQSLLGKLPLVGVP
jgi:hypothetical protein